jgi:hypothetical protein
MPHGKRGPDRKYIEPGGSAEAIQLLRRLTPPIFVDGKTASDPAALAEILCDYAADVDGSKLLHAMWSLLMPTMDRLVLEAIIRECHMLHPETLAEDAMARLYNDLVSGRRMRPLVQWMTDAVGRSIHYSRLNADVLYFKAHEGSTVREKMLQEICAIVNDMPFESRRIAWMTWIDKRSPDEISIETRTPLERVEMFIAQVNAKAAENVGRGEHRRDDPNDGGDLEASP